MGIRANEIGLLSGPLVYREGAPIPRKTGLSPLRDSQRCVAGMIRQKYVVPSVEVTGLVREFVIPVVFRHGSLECYVAGRRVEVWELGSNGGRLRSSPSVGQEVVFSYVPYSNVGGAARRESSVVVVKGDWLITVEEATSGSILFENSRPIEVSMPVVSDENRGLSFRVMRNGSGLVRLVGSGGLTVAGVSSYDIELPYVSFEFSLDLVGQNWIAFY